MEDVRIKEKVEHIAASVIKSRKEPLISQKSSVSHQKEDIYLFSKTYDHMLLQLSALAGLIPMKNQKDIVNAATKLNELSMNLVEAGKELASNKRKGLLGNSDYEKVTVTAVGFEIQMKRIVSMAKLEKKKISVLALKKDTIKDIEKIEVSAELEMLYLCESALEKLHSIRDLCIKRSNE